ncbi:MAG: RNA pseudouridylate synthase domain containing protein 2, partial [Watsoniomyces obsoletus]
MVADYQKRKGEKMTGEMCEVCDTPLYTDPSAEELGIYLHAIAYSDLNGEWGYRSPLPEWAMPPEGRDGVREVG